MEWYPLKFEPILKRVMWGGSRICQFKHLVCDQTDIGESWELSQLPGMVSIVSNGKLKGKSLTELLEFDGEALMGRSVYAKFGNTFPLLVKFIDAQSDLSIQVHPDDALAKERHRCFGKTEMWYVVDNPADSKLIAGFSKEISPEEYIHRIEDDSIEEVLKVYTPKVGDVFYIPAGRVHAIGAGLFVAEIQQSSDITYRLYDYNRSDAQGQFRQLHTELAKAALHYHDHDSAQVHYDSSTNGVSSLVSCSYFVTNSLHLSKSSMQNDATPVVEMARDYSTLDSFVIYVCIQGQGQVLCGKQTLSIKQGETLLLPATIHESLLSTSNELLLLEIFIQL